MFETDTPQRKPCLIPETLMIVFRNYHPRVKDRALRHIEKTNLSETLDMLNGYTRCVKNPDEDEGPSPSKRQKLIMKNKTVNDSKAIENKTSHIYRSADTGRAYACTLYTSDIQLDQNKFYKLKIIKSDDFDRNGKVSILREWGRIGTKREGSRFEHFTGKNSIQDCCSIFKRKFFDLTGNGWDCQPYKSRKGKYVYINIDYREETAAGQISDAIDTNKLEAPVKKAVELIFKIDVMKQTMMELEIDKELMPLGYPSVQNVKEAGKVLNDVYDIHKHPDKYPDSQNSFKHLSNRFYQLIPQSRGDCANKVINNQKEIEKKRQLLNKLNKFEVDYKFCEDGQKTILDYYHQLETEMKPLNADSDEFTLIATYADNTFASAEHHADHRFKIEDIFEIKQKGAEKRFRKHANDSNRMLLWHGTRVSNVASILKDGFKISLPAAVPQAGKMFGQGIYFTDTVSKASLYANHKEQGQSALLFICEVALGEMHEVTSALHNNFTGADLPQGTNSVKAIGRTSPEGFMTYDNDIKVPMGNLYKNDSIKAGLRFNEFIIYDESRYKIKYLVQVVFDINLQ